MNYYPTLQLLKRDLRDRQSKIYQNEEFYYKDVRCVWADYDNEKPLFNRIQCDPCTLQQHKDFSRMRNNLEPNLVVDLS